MGDITDITHSLQARAQELRGAATELERVEAALAALQGSRPAPARTGARGQTKERLAEIIAASPGLRSSDIARQAGITAANAQRPLQQLLEEGRVARDDAKRWAVAQ